MFSIYKISTILLSAVLLTSLFPVSAKAQSEPDTLIVRARVLEIIREEVKDGDNGQDIRQQDLSLEILEGEEKGSIVTYYGINPVTPISSSIYRPGQKVLVAVSEDNEGNRLYFVTDAIRTPALFLLFFLFLGALFIVGGGKRSLRAVLSLIISALVIVYIMAPLILSGTSPIVATLAGSFLLLLVVVYLSEGFTKQAHLAVGSMSISLIVTVLLSVLFVGLARLSGVSSEESAFLVSFGTEAISLKGILLSGIIIGALGVLDDVVISQIAVVRELKETDQSLSASELYRRAIRVGQSHISSMTNTLFLAYAGAALPLIIMLASGETGAGSWIHVINNEDLATEIIRTLAGSLGLILAVPIATWLSARSFAKAGKS